MKVVLILGYCLVFLYLLPNALSTYIGNEFIKALVFYVGIVILLGGLGGGFDWLERKIKNNRDDTKI